MKSYPLYLNGQFVQMDKQFEVVNPATGEAFARMCAVNRERAAQALKDAHEAFKSWRVVPGKGRGELLHKIASELHRRREEIARIITLENGKPLSQSLGEVAMAVDHFRWFAEEARRGYGHVIPPSTESKRHLVVRQPVGVVGAITPSNFPLMLAARKVAAALAAGCTVVLKPSHNTPLSTVALCECVSETQPAKGLLQLVAGDPEEIAREFLMNPICRKISFTGSTEIGRRLISGAAEMVKPLTLELSGNAPVLVFDDCDLDVAVKATLLAKYRNSGQSCMAANRIYVHRTIYPGFLQMIVDRTEDLKLGDGMEEQTQVGPLIKESALVKALEHIDDAVKGGAKLLCGGRRANRPGYFLEPTVLGDVARQSLCMFEESFAPIAAVTPFDTESEVIELANDSQFGLSAYVFTTNLNRALRVAEQLEAGVVGINDGVPATSAAPFGGMKQSGWGKELGSEGMDAFLETKHIAIGVE